ncbi:MAG: hypothetical protein QM811_01435 [Pirellulales bacterium]
MTWVWENAIPVLVLGIVVVVILAFCTYVTQSKGFLYAIFAAILATGGLYFASKAIVTDREAVLATIDAGADAVRANDWTRATSLVAPSAQDTAKKALRDVKGIRVDELSVFSRDVVFPPGDSPGSCDAAVIVRLKISGKYEMPVSVKVHLHFVRESERWYVESYEVGQ